MQNLGTWMSKLTALAHISLSLGNSRISLGKTCTGQPRGRNTSDGRVLSIGMDSTMFVRVYNFSRSSTRSKLTENGQFPKNSS
jgi:hypothetical protein